MRVAKDAKKQAVASVEVDPRDELLDIADATIRALSRSVSEYQDSLLTQYYSKRNQVQKAKEGR